MQAWQRSGFARLFARSDASGLLYGAVVSGGAMAAISSHADASTRVAVATLAVLAIYWLAHVYVQTLSRQLGGDTRLLMPRVAASAREEAIVLFGGIPTVAVYVAVSALGGTPSKAAFGALFFLVALLFTVGYLGARQAELTGLRAVVEAVGAGLFGVLIVIMKALLH
jgi:hypothetical protein